MSASQINDAAKKGDIEKLRKWVSKDNVAMGDKVSWKNLCEL